MSVGMMGAWKAAMSAAVTVALMAGLLVLHSVVQTDVLTVAMTG